MRFEPWSWAERGFYALRARLRTLIDPDECVEELDEELQFHVDRHTDAGIARGLTAEVARTAALGAFGGVQQRREECREVRGLGLGESVIQDLRYAARTARRSRGFAIGAVAVLALGIGANTAVFSVVNAVLLQPLPYPEPDRILQILSDSPTGVSTLASVPRFALWQEETTAFEELAAWRSGGPGVNLSDGDRLEHLNAVSASEGYFRLFGAAVLAGRTFSRSEDRPDGPPVVVLSYGLWMRRFGSDASVLGRMILLGGRAHEVIGILDPRFTPEPPVDVWLPLRADPFSNDHTVVLQVAGRLKRGVTADDARNQVARSASAFRLKFPYAMGPREKFLAVRLGDVIVGNVKPALQLMTGAVVFVLLIACANAASLLLSRANRRRTEIATRAALGARRERLVRQLLSESLVLAFAGGACGLALGAAGVQALIAWSPAEIPRLNRSIPLDGRVLTFTIAISALTGIVFGLLPALSASRVDLTTAFKANENSSPRGQRRLHFALVIAEMVLALVLLVGAGLMIRTVMAQRSFDRGFRADRVVMLEMSLNGGAFDETARVTTLLRNARLRLVETGQVSAIAASRALPIDSKVQLPFAIADRPLFSAALGGPYHGTATVQSISPEYFDVFEIPLEKGRAFNDLDVSGAPPVAIINGAMARIFWGTPRAMELKERITLGARMGPPFADVTRRIVGIVGDVRDPESGEWPGPAIYLPASQLSDAMTAWHNRHFPLTWIVRTTADPRLSARQLTEELRNIAGVPIARVQTMPEVLAAATARTNFTMMLFTIFAAMALILAATGMYALMAYSVQQRSQEIGIRVAFGASPWQVRQAIVGQSAKLAAVGVVCGVAVALVLTRLMVSLIFGIQAWDPLVFGAVAAILTVVSLAAAYVPALRATRISPLDALRGF
jgi:predicted permease